MVYFGHWSAATQPQSSDGGDSGVACQCLQRAYKPDDETFQAAIRPGQSVLGFLSNFKRKNMSGPGVGTINTHPLWKLPQLPNIVSEWAAIIPLICHLASFRTDYETAGRVSLLGRLTVSMFPRLGDLASLSRLCKNGPEYLDEVGGHVVNKLGDTNIDSRQALEGARVEQYEMFSGGASSPVQMELVVQ